MKRLVWAVLVFCALTVPAAAQTHPCSQPEQTVATKGSKIGWCSPADDLSATWNVRIATNAVVAYPSIPPVGGADPATGLYYLEVTLPTGYSKGLYPVTVFGTNEYGAGPASDEKLWQVGGPPAKPNKPRITGSGN